MKRSPLARRTPLRRTGFQPKAPTSKAEFHPSVRAAIERRSGGRCEASAPSCTTWGTMIHHRKLRSQGGDGSADNGLHVCGACHAYIHHHPAESYERGWMIRGSAP